MGSKMLFKRSSVSHPVASPTRPTCCTDVADQASVILGVTDMVEENMENIDRAGKSVASKDSAATSEMQDFRVKGKCSKG